MHIHFEWDSKKATSNLRKHKVSFAEAAEVFHDPLALTLFDEEHGYDEERWIAIGQVKSRRLVVVVHTWQELGGDIIHVRIISAREATVHEAKQYEG